MEPSQNQTSPAIPIAIICGFAMIAIAIFFTNSKGAAPNETVVTTAETEQNDGSIRPVDETDYIYGNPNAPILIIEYSDYECPYCKKYHVTLAQIMQEYGVSGKVAWVYRQFPLTQIHPNASKISEAALCVGEIAGGPTTSAGQSAFWKFTNKIYEGRDYDTFTNVTKLPDYVEEAGQSKDAYIACLESNKLEQRVIDSAEEAYAIGGRGTPYTVLVVGDQQEVINGAQPYSVVKGIVANLIEQLDGTVVSENE